MVDQTSVRVIALYETLHRNLCEDRAFLSACQESEELEHLETQLRRAIRALDEIKGFVRAKK